MKRALSMILVMVMVISMIPAVYAETTETTELLNLVNEAVTADGYVFEYTAETAGTLNVTVGECSPGWRYKVFYPNGTETIHQTKWSPGVNGAFTDEAGNWKVIFYAYSSAEAGDVDGTVSFTVSFTPKDDSGDSGEVVKAEYEVSETALVLGDNTLTLLETAVTTIYVYEPTETGVYTFTAPEGAILGYWGAGSWFLSDPNSTTNTYEWTCTGVGQSAYIGVSNVEGSYTLNVAKTGDYTVVETPIVVYENKAALETFTLPEGATLGGYIDITAETTHTAVLGDDGYYHFNSADGDIILVDMDYQDIVLSDALKSERPVMYVYDKDEDGNDVKYDIGAAVQEYEAVMDENGYYPLTEDLIYFYDNYANGAAVYSFYVTGTYNQENVWMYCMRTVTFPEVTDPEETEPEVTEPEVTEPEETEPEASDPEVTDPEETEPEATDPEVTEPDASEPEATDPLNGVTVLQENVTGTSSTKYVYSYTPDEDGTLSITVGDGSASWNSDVVYFAGVTMTTVGSASGTNADTYEVTVTAGTTYRVRVWTSGSTATPLTVVFYSDAETPTEPTEPTEPETQKNEYEVSTTELTVGDNTVTMLDTAITTAFKFKPTEAGTYTFTGPEGAIVGNWGSNAYYPVDPNSTTNTCKWTCSSVGQSVYIGVSGVDGSVILTVEKQEDVTEPTEPSEPSESEPDETETEPTIPSIPDEDVPAGTVFSVTIDGQTTYFSTSAASSINTQLKKITGTGYVKFYTDVDLGASISNALTFDAGNVTVDLNGCTITLAYASVGALYVDGGTLTVVDTSAEGDGLVQNTNTSGYGIEIWNGTAYLKSGSIYGGSNAVRLYDAGDTFYMEGGNLTAQRYAVNAPASSAAHISGGTLQATLDNQYAVFAATSADVTITGGYFNGTVSGAGLTGNISGGYFVKAVTSSHIATGCELQDNEDTVYLYKVVDTTAEPDETEPTEPSEPETEPTEPSEPETEPSEPDDSEPEATEPEATEPSDSNIVTSGTDVTATVAEPVTYTWTPASNGTLTVTMGAASPGWRYTISDAAGNTVGLPQSGSTEKSATFDLVAGTTYTFKATGWSSSAWEETTATITYTLTFVPSEDSGEVEKTEYEVSDTALALGDNTLTLLETAETTIYVFEPTETGVYTFTAPEGAILGYWGAGSWFLSNPNSTTNTYEWTCTGVGQSAYIGVSNVEGSYTLNVAKTGDYSVVETPIIVYENKAELNTFTLPEDAILGDYIDVTEEAVITVVLGTDGYYHLNTADGPIILVDMNYQDIVLSDALKSERPVMYVYDTDEDGNEVKYDIGAAVQAYEAVMDENGYYPLTEDLIYFYDNYANGAAIYSFYVTGNYNAENIWLYCMRTVTFPVKPVDRWNLVLDDDLKVNFYLNIDAATATQVQVAVADNTVNYNISELETTADGKYIVSVSIAAAQMTDDIVISIVYADNTVTTDPYTVRGYCDTILADEAYSEYYALIKEMLNYGAAAQTYFSYNSDNLANAGITDVAANAIPEAADELVVDGSLSGVAFYGASLVYRDKIAVRFYFSGDVTDLTFTVNGTAYTATAKDDKNYVEIADILPQDLDQQITVTVTDADGNTMTVTYGPMNYIVRMNAKGDDSLQNLMKALYNYHLAAKQLRAN